MKLGKRNSIFLSASAVLLLVVSAIPSREDVDAPPDVPPVAASVAPPAEPPTDPELDVIEAGDEPDSAIQGSDSLALLAEQQQRSQQLTWSRDPFRSSAPLRSESPPVTERPEPRLTGLSIRGDNRSAIIDHQIVNEGDLLSSGYTVGRIDVGSVTLARDAETLTLTLGGGR